MTAIIGKTVLITGAASGIGKRLSQRMLEEGAAKLILWDIHQQNLQSTANELRLKGGKIFPFCVDLSVPDQITETYMNSVREAGAPDILVNNAGIIVGKEFKDHTHADIEKTMAVNSNALMHVTLCCLPDFSAKRQGHIVNIASAAGMMPNPRMSVYAASKWAVIGWSESLRIELEARSPGIKVTTVTPSFIDTGMFQGVKMHSFIPVLTTESVVEKILNGIKQDKIFVRMPGLVHLLPFVKGILPVRWFDYFVGKVLKVYSSMEEFKGRN